MEVLASLSVEDIIKTLLVKASIIDYERLVRLLISACKLAKHPLPRESDLIQLLTRKYCYVTAKDGMLVVKSEHKYSMDNKRLAAIRDYTILTLEENSGTYEVGKLLKETGTKYSQISSFLPELVDIKEGVMTRKSYATNIRDKLNKEDHKHLAEAWATLKNQVAKHLESAFYSVGDE
jgi:hypothetical protein